MNSLKIIDDEVNLALKSLMEQKEKDMQRVCEELTEQERAPFLRLIDEQYNCLRNAVMDIKMEFLEEALTR